MFNDTLFFEGGVNLLWGEKHDHYLRNVCGVESGGELQFGSCSIFDPTTWEPGQWQGIYGNHVHASEAPFWKESRADRFMARRDEVWVGVTYQW